MTSDISALKLLAQNNGTRKNHAPGNDEIGAEFVQRRP